MSIYGNPVTLGPRWMQAEGVSILPYQNLHGYDHPWPAGGWKNLFCNPPEATTYAGVTMTPNSDGSITLSGTANSSAFMYLVPVNIPGNTAVTFSFNNTATNSEIGIRLLSTESVEPGTTVYGTAVYMNANNKTGTLYPSFDAKSINLFVKSNHGDIPAVTLKIQCEIGSSATAWTPYENICPISGWEDCRIWVSSTPNPEAGTTYQTLFGNPPETVHGGTLDVTNGVLTVTHRAKQVPAVKSHISSVSESGETVSFWIYAPGLVKDTSGGNPICDTLKYNPAGSISALSLNEFGWSTSYPNSFFCRMSTTLVGTTQDSIWEYLQANPLTVCSQLSTPVTYQLTPQQISFLGNQYFGANCGPVLIKVGK